MGPFSGIFDFDGNGNLDDLEKTSMASFLDHISVVDRIENDEFYDEEIEDEE
ncbi:MAG: hypothetical protein IJ123_07975 [Blautia sp.]|nr:hypothetical protein [Blautia sp.]